MFSAAIVTCENEKVIFKYYDQLHLFYNQTFLSFRSVLDMSIDFVL